MRYQKLIVIALTAIISLTNCKKGEDITTQKLKNFYKLGLSTPILYDGMLKFNSHDDVKDYYEALSLATNESDNMDSFLLQNEQSLGYTSLRSAFYSGDEFNKTVDENGKIHGACYVGDIVRSSIANFRGELLVGDTIFCYLAPDIMVKYHINDINREPVRAIRERDVMNLNFDNVIDKIIWPIEIAFSSTYEVKYNIIHSGQNAKIEKYSNNTYRTDGSYIDELSYEKPPCSAYERKINFKFNINVDWYESNDTILDPAGDRKTHTDVYSYPVDKVTIFTGDGSQYEYYNVSGISFAHTYSISGDFAVTGFYDYTDWDGNKHTNIPLGGITVSVGDACVTTQYSESKWEYFNTTLAMESEIWYNKDIMGNHFVAKTSRYVRKNNSWKKDKGYCSVSIKGKFRGVNCNSGDLVDETDTKNNVKDVRAAKQLLFNYQKYSLSNGDLTSSHYVTGDYNSNLSRILVVNPCP